MTHTYIPLLALVFTVSAQAQTISFDTDDYKKISVYDSWPESPLRDGRINPAVQVIANHLTEADSETGQQPNTSDHIVGFQRSRYGSNIAGLRVDLKQTFRLTKQSRYVHVMVNRPVTDSRLMLITLGKRSERNGQTADVEQTWSLFSTSAKANGWFDAVFEIKGFSYAETEKNGIDIYSLVICPDVADRSRENEDFICYIDQIEISDTPAPRFASSLYALNFEQDAPNNRNDRHMDAVGISTEGQTQSMKCQSNRMYNNGVAQGRVFSVLPGQSVTPTISYTGTWMGKMTYVDWNNDGQFNPTVNTDGTPATGSDVVSYIGVQVGDIWRDSKGQDVSNGNKAQTALPAFTIPSDTKPGIYRIRYKVDWNSLDPAGNSQANNLITANGGGIADALLNVRGEETTVSASQLNGDIVVAGTEKALAGIKVKRNENLRIKVIPAPGFTYTGVKVLYGYNLDGDSIANENPQQFSTLLPTSAFDYDELTLPDSIMAFGEVRLTGLMVQEHIVELTDSPVDNPTLTQIEMNGTGFDLATRTMKLVDNTHRLQDFTAEKMVGLTQGKPFTASETGKLFIDFNRDGQFSSVSEQVEDATSLSRNGIFRALLQTNQYQMLFLVNLHAPTVRLETDIVNGRFVCRSKTVNGQVLTATGVPVAPDAYKFLGLVAQSVTTNTTVSGTAIIRYGHNLDGEQTVQGIQQWTEEDVTIQQDGRINIGYNNMYGTLRVQAECTADDEKGWELAFSDEFNSDAIDDTKWTVRQRADATWSRFISANPNVTFIRDGSLVCQARRNDFDFSDSSPFLSGMRQSSNSYALLHGYVEARVLTTPHRGNFPAFWMMPKDQSDGWPKCGEIDIWETIDAQNRTWHTVHSNWTHNLGKKNDPQSSNNFAYTQDGEWHTYGLLKEADKLTWFVDGKQVFSYAKSTTQSHLQQGQWPYDKPFYLILNQSVGNGSWAATYDTDFVYETCFDWVRVYEPKSEPASSPPHTSLQTNITI